MSLRFFRRKGAAGAPPEETAVEPEVSPNGDTPEADPAPRRRRTGARPASRSRAGATPAAKPLTDPPPSSDKETAPTKSPTRRGSRGRRGGAGRKPAAAVPVEETAAMPALVVPPRPQGATVEAILAQQTALIQQLAEHEVAAMKAVQATLVAIENRLSQTGDRSTTAERPRVGIFVDVPNVMYAAERQGVALDFGKLLAMLARGREMVRASAYAPISDDPSARLDTQRFVQPFVGHGYRIVTKPLKRYADGSMKANFDVELAMDVLTMSDRLDTVTLVSGDGDFRRLVELVESKGVRVEVVAFSQSTAAELRALADEYIDLNDRLPELRAT
ncbi:MAG: NYN domain-containing protein [Dehalococcoidia bacterium]